MNNEMLQLEYNNIKQEIFMLMQRCDNLIISMYTVSITLLGLGYELNNKLFFLLILFFLIPMQGLLNVRRYHMARCSVYIKRCLETGKEELKWESMVNKIDSKFKRNYFKRSKLMRFSQYIVGIGTVIIALVAIFFYSLESVIISKGEICCSVADMFGMLFTVILFTIICYLVRGYVEYEKVCDNYEKIIDEIEKGE